jgi:hypothetical protein
MYSAAIGAEGNCIHVRCGDSRRGKLSKKFAGDSLRDYLRTSAIGAVCISGKSEMLNLMYGRRQSKPFLCLGWGGGCAGLRHKYKAFKPYKKQVPTGRTRGQHPTISYKKKKVAQRRDALSACA